MTGLLGVGSSLPHHERKNDDPVFEPLLRAAPEGSDLFQGYRSRRVLGEGESIVPHVVRAARCALENAGRSPDDVDVLVGRVSLGDRLLPEGLAEVHAGLRLRPDCWVLPIADDFTNALSGLVVARGLLASGLARLALIAVGSDWSRNVDYLTPQALSAADGAGALVVGPLEERGWALVCARTEVRSDLAGVMHMPWVASGRPHFQIETEGFDAFVEFGAETTPLLALDLLEEHSMAASEVTLISHQASTVLLERWRDVIRPAAHLDTLAEVGNATVANIPLTLASRLGEVRTSGLLLLGVGPMQHAVAVLFRHTDP